MELVNQIDETICFNEKNIRIIGSYNEPWFVAKDICEILKLKDVSNALLNIPEKWKGTKVISTLGGNQDMRIINEAGLYKLIMRSNKPVAQKFQEVVCEEILPSLRKKGEYKIQSIIHKNKELEEEKLKIEEEKNNLDAQNQISQKLIKDLNKKLERKQRTKYELSNSIYIISNKFFEGYFKIGKSSSFNNRLNSYSSGSPVEYKVEYICKVRNKCEETAVENMVLQILKVYRVKNHMDQDREWLHGVDLEIIKKEIDSCVNFINKSRDKYKEDKTVEEKEIIEEDEQEEINYKENSEEEVIDKENSDEELQEEEKIEEITKPKKIKNLKYIVDVSQLKIKRNNPIEFKNFIDECCEVGDNLYTIISDIKTAYKIWSKNSLTPIFEKFTEYMSENFVDTRIIIDNQRRHVYKGLKLKPLTYTNTTSNFDFEEFINSKCEVNHLYRISYYDFYYFFTEWKKETDPTFKLNKYDKLSIQEILELQFVKARILHSVKSKTKNLCGIMGIGLKENNFGLIEKKRQNKMVGEFDIETDELLNEYESIYSCSDILDIPFSTFGTYIRNKTVIEGKYYKLL
jgi:prophage antirepressor-like protein